MRHVESRDEASPEETLRRTWKDTWPMYDALGANAFAPTKRNALKGSGNTNPRRAYQQKASVELTPEAFSWLNHRLEEAFEQHGKLSPAELDSLDWPKVKYTRASC